PRQWPHARRYLVASRRLSAKLRFVVFKSGADAARSNPFGWGPAPRLAGRQPPLPAQWPGTPAAIPVAGRRAAARLERRAHRTPAQRARTARGRPVGQSIGLLLFR